MGNQDRCCCGWEYVRIQALHEYMIIDMTSKCMQMHACSSFHTGSFGTEAAFAQNLVNSLDRSYLLREQERTGKPSKDPIQVRHPRICCASNFLGQVRRQAQQRAHSCPHNLLPNFCYHRLQSSWTITRRMACTLSSTQFR